MAVRFERRNAGATDEAIRTLEAKVGASVPEEYLQFLRQQDGGVPETNEFALPGASASSGVNEFLSVWQIIREKESLGTRLPRSVLPVAYAEGGNLVCIDAPRGDVLYWDHELEDTDPFTHVAVNFPSFWESVTKFDVKDVKLRPGQVKSVWVDPDLRKTQG